MIYKYSRLLRERLSDRGSQNCNYTLTRDSMREVNRLSTGAYDLLEAILDQTTVDYHDKSVLVIGDHQDFGYESKRKFYRHRSELMERNFVQYDGVYHFVNPTKIYRPHKGHLQYLRNIFLGENWNDSIANNPHINNKS